VRAIEKTHDLAPEVQNGLRRLLQAVHHVWPGL
jgi:hypothetical protein